MKKITFWFLSLSLLAGVAFSAAGAEIVKPAEDNPNVVVGVSESHKNLYTAGSNVVVNGKTLGDFTAAGGTVILAGDVEQGVLIAGGNINMSGSVGGNARIVGGSVAVTGVVKGDLVLLSGNATIGNQSSVGGDLLIAAGSVSLEAPVKGSIRAAAGDLYINSKVDGDIYVKTSQALEFGPKAEVMGRIFYTGPAEAVVQSGAKIGKIEFILSRQKSFKNEFGVILSLAFLIKVLAWVLAGWLLLKFRRPTVEKIVASCQTQPWQNLGWGALGFFVIPLATILLLITFVGYYTAGIVALWYILVLVVAKVLASLVLGFWLLKFLHKNNEKIVDWQAIIIGVVVCGLLGFIPVVGWVILAIVFLATLGAILRIVKESLKITN